MKSTTRLATRYLVLTVATCAIFALSHSSARADEVHISGFTTGCFGNGCVPGSTATFGGLSFSGSTFSGTTMDGLFSIGANGTPGSNFNNLGSMNLSTAPQSYGLPFYLFITFTSPQGINGSNVFSTAALVSGTVGGTNQGGVFLNFSDAPIFSFNDTDCEPDPTGGLPGQRTTCGFGSFQFQIFRTAVAPGNIVPLTGIVVGAQQTSVPEPATLLLLGTGLTGIAAKLRQRRKKQVNTQE